MSMQTPDTTPLPPPPDASFAEMRQALALVGMLGFAMVLAIGGGFALGYWLGGYAGHPATGGVAGCVAGTALGFAWGYRRLMRFFIRDTHGPRDTLS